MYKETQKFILCPEQQDFYLRIKNMSALGLYVYMFMNQERYYYFHELTEHFEVDSLKGLHMECYNIIIVMLLEAIKYLLDENFIKLG